jgi:ZIP family zinc transporter
MTLAAVLVSIGAFASALAGGMVAMHAARWIGLVIALGAGIRIGAAFFDLIPESIEHLGGSVDAAMLAAAFGFLAFYVLEKSTLLHVGHETATELDHGALAHRHVGIAGATGMSLHSFLDGVALAAGLIVGDGIGIVSLLLASRMPTLEAYRWVALVAIAPLFGVLLAAVIPIPEAVLGALLGTFAGFFLYIGAAELLPEAHRSDRSTWVIIATLVGAAAIYAFSAWAGVVGAH